MISNVNKMQTVILAGGIGNRVFPLAVNTPKPMFKLLGKPLILFVIETLKEAGLRDLIIVTGHNSEKIKNYLKNGEKWNVNIRYTYQEKALGQANALETTEDLVEDDFFVINADDVFESSLIKGMMSHYKKTNADIILSCKPVHDTWKWGIIKLKDERVEKIVEKPLKGQEPSNLSVLGVYILKRNIFKYIKKTKVSDHQYEASIQKIIDDGDFVTAYRHEGFFAAFKYPWDLFTINEYLMKKNITKPIIEEDVNVSEKAQIEGNVWIRKGVKIFENTIIRGPCYIGSNSFIGNNCLILNHSSLGDNCVVGFASEVKHSIIGDNCWFHTNYIGNSIISDDCSFGARTVTANLRFDEKTVKLKIDRKEIDSGLSKLGVIMGDECKTGIGSCIMPGIRVGPNSIVGPNVCLYDDLEPNQKIFVHKNNYVKIRIKTGI